MLVHAKTFVPAVQELVGGLLPDTCAANKHSRRILLFGSSMVRDLERGISLQIPPVCLPFILTKEILVNSPRQVEVLKTSIAFLEEFMQLMAQLEEQGHEASFAALPFGACTAFQEAAHSLAWQVFRAPLLSSPWTSLTVTAWQVVQLEFNDEAALAEAQIALLRTICQFSRLALDDPAMQEERLAYDNARAQYYAFFQEDYKDKDPVGTCRPAQLIALLDQRIGTSVDRFILPIVLSLLYADET